MKKPFQILAVLKGGPSAERDVSLRSGAAVANALREAGLTVHEVDVKGFAFEVPAGVQAVFPVLHGEFGEDGMAQRRLEELGLPYVGSRSWEMPRSFDKEISHALLAAAGVPTAEYRMLAPGENDPGLPVPLVLKAPRQGSSIGVEIVREASAVPEALARVRRYGERVLVERFIPGTECTVGFLGNEALPIVEIRPALESYDYEAKYQRNDTRYLCPAPFDPALAARIRDVATRAFAALGGRHLGRVDFRVQDDGQLFVLEMNPLPGFTATSLLPKAAAAAGMNFVELCTRILAMAE
jgi:D-alanine-D-alanine ligase